MHEALSQEITPLIAFYAKSIKLLPEYQLYLNSVSNNPNKNQDLNEYCIIAYKQEECIYLEVCGLIDDIPFQNQKIFGTGETEQEMLKKEIYNVVTMFEKHHRYILQFKNFKKYNYISLTKEVDDWIFKKIKKDIDKQK